MLLKAVLTMVTSGCTTPKPRLIAASVRGFTRLERVFGCTVPFTNDFFLCSIPRPLDSTAWLTTSFRIHLSLNKKRQPVGRGKVPSITAHSPCTRLVSVFGRLEAKHV